MQQKSICILFTLTALFFSCSTKPTTTTETTSQAPVEIPDEKNMEHYESHYQNWTDGMTMDETFTVADIWYDGKFIIVSEGIQPKFTIKIGKKGTEEQAELSGDSGGTCTRTLYELETNEQGYDQLIVFTNEFQQKVLKYDYIRNFIFLGKNQTKSYYGNRFAE
jgi:hypothetical protein